MIPLRYQISFNMVREMRIELTQDTLYAPQTYASTSSATRAFKKLALILSLSFNFLSR